MKYRWQALADRFTVRGRFIPTHPGDGILPVPLRERAHCPRRWSRAAGLIAECVNRLFPGQHTASSLEGLHPVRLRPVTAPVKKGLEGFVRHFGAVDEVPGGADWSERAPQDRETQIERARSDRDHTCWNSPGFRERVSHRHRIPTGEQLQRVHRVVTLGLQSNASRPLGKTDTVQRRPTQTRPLSIGGGVRSYQDVSVRGCRLEGNGRRDPRPQLSQRLVLRADLLGALSETVGI
jgi:hypothetical protein